MIPYSTQTIDEADIQAVSDVLRSGWLTQGPAIERFEKSIADYCGVRHAVAVSSATAGLHLAALAIGLEAGKLLWTSPNTFVASANCARYCGAQVDFVDIDPRTLNMSVSRLQEKLESCRRNGKPLPDVIVPVHFGGVPCELQKMALLAEEYGFHILEDAAHALSARFQEEKIGNSMYSRATVLSFHAVKIITAAEGGMVLTNDDTFAAHVRSLRSHGITRDPQIMTTLPDGGWYYQQVALGYHYRMTDMQAALAVSQLHRIEEFRAARQRLAAKYHKAFGSLDLSWQEVPPNSESAWHLFVIRVPQEKRKRIFNQMRDAGIGVNVHYIPVHLQPYYRDLGFEPGNFPEAEQYYREAISLPIYPNLSDNDQQKVIAFVQNELLS